MWRLSSSHPRWQPRRWPQRSIWSPAREQRRGCASQRALQPRARPLSSRRGARAGWDAATPCSPPRRAAAGGARCCRRGARSPPHSASSPAPAAPAAPAANVAVLARMVLPARAVASVTAMRVPAAALANPATLERAAMPKELASLGVEAMLGPDRIPRSQEPHHPPEEPPNPSRFLRRPHLFHHFPSPHRPQSPQHTGCHPHLQSYPPACTRSREPLEARCQR